MSACDSIPDCGNPSAPHHSQRISGPVSADALTPPKACWPLPVAAAALLALATTAAAQQETRTLEHQGVARSYIISNAPVAAPVPRPAMIVLHGRREPTEPNRSSPPLNVLAARERFVAVYPAAIAGAWNWPTRIPSETIPLSMAGTEPADDIGFIVRLIDTLVAQRIADPAQIYVSGASMGGFMTYALMCTHPGKIAAAAPMIASMSDKQIEMCKPTRPVPAAILAGTADEVVPYGGRQSLTTRLTSVPETLAFWWNLHECSGHAATRMTPPDQVKSDGVTTLRIDSTGCKVEGALRHYRVEGGGHTLPSLRPQAEAEFKRFGPRSTEFETSSEVWEFLRRFKL